MRNILALAVSLSITTYAQQPPPQPPAPAPAPSYAPQDAPPLTESPAPSASPATGDITLPAGTKIQLYLTNPLHSRTAQTGDAVQAEVAFPVVIANQLAIPRGAYVEGAVPRNSAGIFTSRQNPATVHQDHFRKRLPVAAHGRHRRSQQSDLQRHRAPNCRGRMEQLRHTDSE